MFIFNDSGRAGGSGAVVSRTNVSLITPFALDPLGCPVVPSSIERIPVPYMAARN